MQSYQSTKWLRHFVLLKPLQGLVFNLQKCCHSFVNWDKKCTSLYRRDYGTELVATAKAAYG